MAQSRHNHGPTRPGRKTTTAGTTSTITTTKVPSSQGLFFGASVVLLLLLLSRSSTTTVSGLVINVGSGCSSRRRRVIIGGGGGNPLASSLPRRQQQQRLLLPNRAGRTNTRLSCSSRVPPPPPSSPSSSINDNKSNIDGGGDLMMMSSSSSSEVEWTASSNPDVTDVNGNNPSGVNGEVEEEAMSKTTTTSSTSTTTEEVVQGGRCDDDMSNVDADDDGDSASVVGTAAAASKGNSTSSASLMPKELPKILTAKEKRREFEMNIGRAVDVLRKDYPYLLSASPDYSIFRDDLEVIDPSGVTLHGISAYKKSFQFVRAIVSFFYSADSSGITFRLMYDWARNNIRVSWHVILVPKTLYGGYKRRLHVDGISVYEMDRTSGLISTHRFEQMLINDIPVKPPQGIFHALTDQVVGQPNGVPVGSILGLAGASGGATAGGGGLSDSGKNSGGGNTSPPNVYLAALGAASGRTTGGDNSNSNNNPRKESDAAYQRKNASRKKFGLPPLSREEFDIIEEQVRDQVSQQRKSIQTATELSQRLAKQERKQKSLFERLFADVVPRSCESNEDCERPEVCCDFVFKQVCCASGAGVYDHVPGTLRPAPVLVPANIPDPRNF